MEEKGFLVYWKGEYPKPKKIFHKGEFKKRQQARMFCKNHFYDNMVIVHPDGREEVYKRGSE